MAGRHQNERLLEHGTKATVLGGALHETRHGRDQKQRFGNENGSGITRSIVWDVIRQISRCLRVLEASLQVNIFFSLLINFVNHLF